MPYKSCAALHLRYPRPIEHSSQTGNQLSQQKSAKEGKGEVLSGLNFPILVHVLITLFQITACHYRASHRLIVVLKGLVFGGDAKVWELVLNKLSFHNGKSRIVLASGAQKRWYQWRVRWKSAHWEERMESWRWPRGRQKFVSALGAVLYFSACLFFVLFFSSFFSWFQHPQGS